MNRRILIQVTTPGVIIGLILFVVCLAGAWYIDRLQTNMARILNRNVQSLQAAQTLENRVRQLRFHTLLNLTDPKRQVRRQDIENDHQGFEDALQSASQAAHTPEEQALVARIQAGYNTYSNELVQMDLETGGHGAPVNISQWTDQHPIKNIIQPCQELLDRSRNAMDGSSKENSQVSRQVRLLMILLGVVGPISGLLVGFAVARGLSRSIYQLSVRVQDMARVAQLDPDVAAVSIQADGDMQNLDRQLQQVVQRVENVTARFQRQQREMLRAEQLSAVGKLAASVAHEVRNPLTSIKMLVEAALRAHNPKPLRPEDLQVIHGEIARLERTVQSFLDFARLPSPKRCRDDLCEVVGHAVDLIQARARQQKVEVVTKGPEEPLHADVDRDQFCNVLVNLSLNALDAMPNGGRLEIELGPVTERWNSFAANSSSNGPNTAIGQRKPGALFITVADTGPGISADMEPRLFTPFASSKPTGTGLGLSVCRRIVEEHGGFITASNRPEGGACFMIQLASPDEQLTIETQKHREIRGIGN